MNRNYQPIKPLISAFLILLSFTGNAQMITTIAGGSIGEGKPATSVGMTVYYHITAWNVLAVDANDNLYVIDNNTLRIRKVSAATGILSTIAGNGNTNFSGDGQPAIQAGLGNIYAIALDRQGNIYLSTTGRIRKINAATGIINTIAGTGAIGYFGDGGPAAQAVIQAPGSITIDTAGNIYFTDQQRIRKITAATGIITTIAGSSQQGYTGDGGPAAQALIAAPRSLTSDEAGNLYWVDNNNNAIRKITAATGIISTIVGSAGITGSGFSGDGGPAALAKISFPTQVVADSTGNLYLSDNNRVRKIDAATGIINTIAGTALGGYTPDGVNAQVAGFNRVGDLALSRSGNLFLREENNLVIRKIAATTQLLSTVYGNRTIGISNIGGPVSNAQLHLSRIAVDRHNNTYLSDPANDRIYRIDAATNTITTIAGTGVEGMTNDGGPAISADISPYSIAFDSNGDLYFTNGSVSVRKITMATGIISTVAGTGSKGHSGDGGPATAATFDGIWDLEFDQANNLYVTDTYNNTIRKISATTGIVTTIAGNGVQGYSGDGGPATAASLMDPENLAIDRTGNVYISCGNNNVIRRVDAITGLITTVAGTGARGYNGDNGPATNAMLSNPGGLATDTAGNLFIADGGNNRVRKITVTTGNISTVAGINYGGFNGDSIPAVTAALLQPSSLSMDTAGNLLIADKTYRIRKLYDTIPHDTIAAPNPTPDPPPVTDSNVIVTKAYPNPAHDNLSVTLKGNISGQVSVIVSTLGGNPIATKQFQLPPTMDYIINMHLPGIQPGVYYVKILVNNEKQVHILMVH